MPKIFLTPTSPMFLMLVSIDDLEKHFTYWAQRCRNGRYELLPKLVIYNHIGMDSDDLDIWQRNNADSSQVENLHQKLYAGISPIGMGVEMAHYHHVLLVFMYVVYDNVCQHREPDFGHWMLDIEDRIQKKIK